MDSNRIEGSRLDGRALTFVVPVASGRVSRDVLAELLDSGLEDVQVVCVCSEGTGGDAEEIRQMAGSGGRIVLETGHYPTRADAWNRGIGLATGRYLVLVGRDGIPEGVDWSAAVGRCCEQELDVMPFRSTTGSREYVGVFSGQQLYVKMQVPDLDFRYDACSSIYRTGFLLGNGISLGGCSDVDEEVFCLETMLYAGRAMAWNASIVGEDAGSPGPGDVDSAAEVPFPSASRKKPDNIEKRHIVSEALAALEAADEKGGKLSKLVSESPREPSLKFRQCLVDEMLDIEDGIRNMVSPVPESDILGICTHMGSDDGPRLVRIRNSVSRGSHEDEVSGRDGRIRALERDVSKLKGEKSSLDREVRRLGKEVSRLSHEVDLQQSRVARRDDRIAELQATVGRRDKRIEELENSTSMRVGMALTALPRKIKDSRSGKGEADTVPGPSAVSAPDGEGGADGVPPAGFVPAGSPGAPGTSGEAGSAVSSQGAAAVPVASLQQDEGFFGRWGSRDDGRPSVIASLTSYPMRLDTIGPAVESIASQTVKPDRIVLWLARGQFPDGELPHAIEPLYDLGLEVMWCEDDTRSYKRSINSLQEFPDDILVFFDDDLVYQDDLLESMLRSHEEHPRAVIATRVHRMTFGDDGYPLPYARWVQSDRSHVGEERMDLLATSGAGTLYPPHVLPDEASDQDAFMRLAPTADDIWLKVMQAIAGTPVVLARSDCRFRYAEGTQEVSALWDENQYLDLNDRALSALLEEYDDIHGPDDTLLSRMRMDR